MATLHCSHHLNLLTNPSDHKSLPKLHNPRRTKTLKFSILCKKPTNEDAFKEKKTVSVDYDKGEHQVSVHLSGLRKADLPKHRRVRVQGNRYQKDWAISDVVQRILKLKNRKNIDGVLNHWVGRFARKNFPLLVREITQTGSIEHSNHVFRWMKLQQNYCARNDIYNMMIRLHARHNQTDQARGLFFEMQEWRCKPDSETYNALINVHGRAGQWRWAMNIMDDMLRAAIPPSRSTYNNLINACGSSGNWREALNISKKMTENGVGPDLVTHNIVLSAYKSGGQYAKALSYFELMKGTNIRPDTTTLNIMIHCLVKCGQYSEALDIFSSMREKGSECKPDVVTFTSIIHMYSVTGQIKNCQDVFNTMLAESYKPNIIMYNALLGAYASQGMATEAFMIFDEIKKKGFRPDVVSYTSLLNAYGKSQQPRKAREVFDDMKKNRLKPNIVSYNALIDAYGCTGFLAEAVEVLREMEQNGVEPNVVSICTLLSACGKCSKRVKIDSILSAAELRGIELNTVAYNSAIGSYMNLGEYDNALSLYETMRKKKKVRPDSATYNILISGCVKMSKYGDAINFLNEMIELKVSMSKEVYSSAICAYSKQGKIAEAESMFMRMKESGCSPDEITYTTMLHAYSTAGKLKRAYEMFQEMDSAGCQLDSIACSAFMRGLNKGEHPAKVLSVAEFMRQKNIPFTDAVFFEIVSACSLLRDWKTVIELIRVMEPSFSTMSVGLVNQLLNLVGKSGKIESMMKLFYKIVESGTEISFSTYSILLKNLLASRNWRKYIEVLEWMEDSGVQPSSEMYKNIVLFAQKSIGTEYYNIIQEKIESLKRKSTHQIPAPKLLDSPL